VTSDYNYVFFHTIFVVIKTDKWQGYEEGENDKWQPICIIGTQYFVTFRQNIVKKHQFSLNTRCGLPYHDQLGGRQ